MSDKIRAQHLERKAILYVRQSSPYQVLHNLESQKLQYAMEARLRQLHQAQSFNPQSSILGTATNRDTLALRYDIIGLRFLLNCRVLIRRGNRDSIRRICQMNRTDAVLSRRVPQSYTDVATSATPAVN